MNKHTPSPWYIVEDQTALYVQAPELDGEDSLYLAKVMGRTKGDRANARLIAAAPDLYEAAKEVLDQIEWAIANEREPMTSGAEILRAAIAKAEGNQP